MKEHEIRPEALPNRQIGLSARDAVSNFSDALRLSMAAAIRNY